VLWNRRQAIARAFLGDVAPLDYFRVEGQRLCWDDLWLGAGLGGGRATEYVVDGEAAATERVAASGATSCMPLAARPGYQVVRLGARRGSEKRPAHLVRVHLMADASGARILGVER
jgi:hypothetical protein